MMPKISVIVHCVVVPIYKDFEELSNGELTSLTQLYKVLGKHQIFFIGPKDFDWTKFLSQAEKWNIFPKIKEFDKFYFENIVGYNRLMISIDFLKKFKEFGYILIYQLDAYVFKDELEYWCEKEFDFIGAPWFKGWNTRGSIEDLAAVGNGGFSLRKNVKAISILKRLKYIYWLHRFLTKVRLNDFKILRLVLVLFNFYFRIASKKALETLLNDKNVNEDIFWAIYVGDTFKDFKVANVKQSIPFSFETSPSLLFKENNNKLPFGCHAWEKYEPEFWKNYINTAK